MSTDEDADEAPSLSDVSSEIVAALRSMLKSAKTTMKQGSDDDKILAETRILAIGNTSAKVLEAARKLQTDGLAAVRNMSFKERAEMFVGWYISLPPGYRQDVRRGMDEAEQSHQLRLPTPATED